MVDLGNAAERAALLEAVADRQVSGAARRGRDRTIPESSIIIEYLDNHYPGRTRLIPADPELALQTRLRDRFYDLYVHLPMQKIVGDRFRPAGRRIRMAWKRRGRGSASCYGMIDSRWRAGPGRWERRSARRLRGVAGAVLRQHGRAVRRHHKNVAAYFERLKARPSFARVLKEAEPYFGMFPKMRNVRCPRTRCGKSAQCLADPVMQLLAIMPLGLSRNRKARIDMLTSDDDAIGARRCDLW